MLQYETIDLSGMNEDEKAVCRHVIDRIRMGRHEYGPLDLDKDKRDWICESVEEQIDTIIMMAFEIIRRMRQLRREDQ